MTNKWKFISALLFLVLFAILVFSLKSVDVPSTLTHSTQQSIIVSRLDTSAELPAPCLPESSPQVCRWSSPKGMSNGRVQIRGRRIFVNGDTFLIRGIAYNPVPAGIHQSSARIFIPELWNRDLPLLRAMGCNTIRTWAMIDTEAFLDACWNNGRDPIYVIMGFPISNDSCYSDTGSRKAVRDRFRAYIDRFRKHPAVLMWAVGNENNYGYTKSSISDFYGLCNDLARDAYDLEKNLFHPVAIVNGRLFEAVGAVGDRFSGTDDETLAYVDVWGTNLYWGRSFEDQFTRYSTRSAKPLWISEYGVDAFDNLRSRENEDAHAEWILGLWREIATATDTCIGGTLMEYSDEWWKAEPGSVDTQDTGGFPGYATQPDDFANEEWWGIMKVAPTIKGEPDLMTPRLVYNRLKTEWAARTYTR